MAVGIANNTVKFQQLQPIELRFFWFGEKVVQDMYKLSWHPRQENLADYQSKHQPGAHHVVVCPWYLHMEKSPRVLPQALRPSALKGCVETFNDRIVHNVPLPRAPQSRAPRK